MTITTELIIACYNQPEHLRCVLEALEHQNVQPDSVCFADDGSGQETAAVIKAFEQRSTRPIRHIWHEDKGFRKNVILNKAIASAKADYLIFIDGDCLMHPSYIKRHITLRAPHIYLSGGLIRLSENMTETLLKSKPILWNKGRPQTWSPQRVSDWLKAMPLPQNMMGIFDRLTTVQKNWSGCNASCFREAAIKINGFDESMTYGAEDKEFGVRLANAGIIGRHIRYSAPLFHLEHARGYANKEIMKRNKDYVKKVRKSKITWTPNGIRKSSEDEAHPA